MENPLIERKISSLPTEESAENDILDISHLTYSLKRRAVRGGGATFTGQICSKVIQLGSTMVLARVLIPQDFGVIAMITVVTNFVGSFKDMGLSMATVQRENTTHEQVSNLFWINVGLSLLIFAIVIALAPAIAWFYGERKLLWLTIALSTGFIFGGFATQHIALLRRQMRFGTVAAVNVVGMLIGAAVGILTALVGAGVWALVYMSLAQSLIVTFTVWFVCSWRPSLPKRGTGVGSMVAFGGNLTGFNVLNYFARNMDNVLIGRVLGAGQLGLYNRAYQLLLLPLRQITWPISAVAIPTLSRLQDDPVQYRRYYYRAISIIALVTMPLVVIMAALSDEIIIIVLGAQWIEAAIIFKVLAFAAFVQPIVSTAGWVYVSLGQTKRMMHLGLITVPLILLSFGIGIFWGALGVAISYTICFLFLITGLSLFFAFRYSPIRFLGFIDAVWRPVAISIAMYIVVELTCLHFNSAGPVWILLWGCVGALITIALFMLLWPRARSEVAALVGIVKMLKG